MRRLIVLLVVSLAIGLVPASGADAAVNAFFTFARAEGPLEIVFDAALTTSDSCSSPEITAYDWDFGDGATLTASDTIVSHTYASTGSYQVRLDAHDCSAQTGTVVQTVEVNPVASFTAAPTEGESPLTVTFNGSASEPSGTITAWHWDFGDGGIATTDRPNTEHAFTAGRWDVSLVVEDDNNMQSTPVVIEIVVTAPTPPVASFTVDVPPDAVAPLEAFFDGSGSTSSPSFDIVQWEWDFGDGTTGVTSGPTVAHDYSVGDFSPSLVVVDARGLRSPAAIGRVVAGVEGFGPPIPLFGPAYGSGYGGVEGGHDAVAAPSPSRLWYFAEGHTGDGFQEFLTLQNPSTSQAADVLINFYFGPGQGEPSTQSLLLAPSSRATVVVNDVVGNGKDVSMQVAVTPSSPPIVAERPMYFRANAGLPGGIVASGGHNVVGATAPSKTWSFAEGYTGPGFVTYLTLQNPASAPAVANLTFLLETGEARTATLALEARQRQTVNVADVVGVGRSVSTIVDADRGIVVERPMYFSFVPETGGGTIDGGHNVMGARTPGTDLTFAEGFTGPGFTEYLTVAATQPTTATFTYAFSDGRPAQTEVLPLTTGRHTLLVNSKVEPGDVSVRIQADRPVVAERPMYFRADPGLGSVVDDGHVVLGGPVTTGDQYLAEGYTGPGFVEYLTLASFSDTSQVVRVKVLYDDGTPPDALDVEFAPQSRRTLRVGRDVGRPGRSVSVVIENRSGAPILAERPMYFRFNPFPATDPAFHDFLFGRPNGSPARWNPCDPIGFRVNPGRGPANAVDLAREAVSQVSAVTGIPFVYEGTTAVIPNSTYFNSQPATELVITYADQDQTDVLSGAAGVGSPIAFLNPDGVYVIVAAFVVVDEDSRIQPKFGYGYTWGNLLLHEVGHAMGLAHPAQESELMHPPLTGGAPNGLNQGDQQGLRELGAAKGCLTSPF